MAETANELIEPYEILELTDGEVRQLRITNYQVGNVTIRPPWLPGGKVVRALRVHVPHESKTFFPYYWDITGKTLVAQMVPYLEAGGYQNKVFTITKYGVAPKARFTLEVRPA